jgi:hypothetical protein
MAKLKPKEKKKAEGFILETGFMSLFIIHKLYNFKTTKDDEVKNDLLLIKPKGKTYKKVGSLKESMIQAFKNESDLLENKGAEMIENDDFFSIKANAIFEEAINFFSFFSSKVEIYRDKKIQEIYFIKVPYSEYLDEADRDKFNHEVERSTTLNKVKSLFQQVDYFTTIMQFAYYLENINFTVRFFFSFEAVYTMLSFYTVIGP